MDNFFEMQIQSASTQVLETVYIISTSKNIDTIKSRYEFLLQRISDLRQNQSNPTYSEFVRLAIEYYKVMYKIETLNEYQFAILSDPNGFDLNNFYCTSLGNAMKRFCSEQTDEISAMKRETAKAKRSLKVLELIKSTKDELQTKCSSASSYSTVLIELESLEKSFNH